MVRSSRENGIVLRVGIHSGEIVAGVPDKFTKEQGVYGAAVHLASRLEHMAQPGDICVTESTYKLVQASCDGRALGHQDVKGFPRPIAVYRLVGIKPARRHFVMPSSGPIVVAMPSLPSCMTPLPEPSGERARRSASRRRPDLARAGCASNLHGSPGTA